MTDVQAPSPEKSEAVYTKLAEFRNGLPENEQAMLDSLVAAAAGTAPSDKEQKDFAKKLESYRDSLPEDERPLIDAVMISSGAVEEDVAGHVWVKAWEQAGWAVTYPAYAAACFARSGTQRITYSGTWWSGGQIGVYRCYDWR